MVSIMQKLPLRISVVGARNDHCRFGVPRQRAVLKTVKLA